MPTSSRQLDPKLLEILVCPLTKQPLRYDPDRQELVSERAGLAYPIRDGIPIMLVDEARVLDDADVATALPAGDAAETEPSADGEGSPARSGEP